ncbi:MAG: lysine exporter LysO family protein [Angelakisella sp.]|jgi:uncharacterized membrane protein YbjE (DUF340 family)|nr:lysine exporter LysO family protein [Angelakisella sp.]
MVLLALGCLLGGVLCGLFFFSPGVSAFFTGNSELFLWGLMFLVGISVGLSKGVFAKVKSYGLRVLILPLSITAASAAAGLLCAPLTGLSLGEGVSIASGMGWYSLTGILLTDIAGAEVGAIGFLGNLLREMFSFLVIPWIASHLNHYTAIAPAGATSEDTTLAVLIRCTREEIVVLAVFNGVLCSAAVPVLIRFFSAIL